MRMQYGVTPKRFMAHISNIPVNAETERSLYYYIHPLLKMLVRNYSSLQCSRSWQGLRELCAGMGILHAPIATQDSRTESPHKIPATSAMQERLHCRLKLFKSEMRNCFSYTVISNIP